MAVEKFLNIKGHNAIHPCRSCAIQAIHGVSKTYYVPLDPPKNIRNVGMQSWDPAALPLRQHVDFRETATRIHATATKAAKERIAKETGIKGLPAMSHIQSLDYARAVPWEWFHLLLENVIPNLVDFWTGNFKGLSVGTEEFEIEP